MIDMYMYMDTVSTYMYIYRPAIKHPMARQDVNTGMKADTPTSTPYLDLHIHQHAYKHLYVRKQSDLVMVLYQWSPTSQRQGLLQFAQNLFISHFSTSL